MTSVHDEPLGALGRRIGRTIRAARAAQDRSQNDLARDAGLSRTILARIERGEGNPSVETLWRVAQALRLPLGALLAEDHAPRVRVVRARSTEPVHGEAGMTAWLLHAEGREHRSEVFELELPTGAEQRSEPHLPGTEELVVCVAGRVLAGPADGETELAPGDALWFVADVAHRYVGVEDGRALNVILYPGRGTAA